MLLFYHFELWSLTGRSQHAKILIAPKRDEREDRATTGVEPIFLFSQQDLIMTINNLLKRTNHFKPLHMNCFSQHLCLLATKLNSNLNTVLKFSMTTEKIHLEILPTDGHLVDLKPAIQWCSPVTAMT